MGKYIYIIEMGWWAKLPANLTEDRNAREIKSL